jgi:hypothetical protein
MSAELATIERGAAPAVNPALQIIAAKDAAKVCGEIVKRCAVNIGGRRYIPIEGWQTIAAAFGCVLSAGGVEAIEGGIRATGRVVRVADGAALAEAEGMVGDDETTWAKRPAYARRAMAQTRAMSRAARSAFAFVVTLIDKNLSATPAEEVPDGGFSDSRNAAPSRFPRRTAAAPPPDDDGPPLEEREEPPASRPLFTKGGQRK